MGLVSQKKNDAPEKTVVKACLIWMRINGWDVDIFESKSTYDPRRGIYRQQAMTAGICDCLGHLPVPNLGIGVAIEFKAPGRRSTFNAPKNYRQQEFLKAKINTGCFGCVVDSVEMLKEIFEQWQKRALKNEGIEYLNSKLP